MKTDSNIFGLKGKVNKHLFIEIRKSDSNCSCGSETQQFMCKLCYKEFLYAKCMGQIYCRRCLDCVEQCQKHAKNIQAVCICCTKQCCSECLYTTVWGCSRMCLNCIDYVNSNYVLNYNYDECYMICTRSAGSSTPKRNRILEHELQNDLILTTKLAAIVIYRKCGIYNIKAAMVFADRILYYMHGFRPRDLRW